jgi:minimal PKS chain-length factor (CLF/KS beta)
MTSRRAVVTGIGIVAPSGTSTEAHWKTVLSGESKIGPITAFDPEPYETRLAGEVTGFDPADHAEGRLIVQTDRWTWLAFAAANAAFEDAALDPASLDPYSISAALASSSGGNQFGQGELQRLWSRADRTVSGYQSIAWFYAASVGQLSIKHQLKGPCNVLVAEAAGGLDSLAHAARSIERGVSVVLAGGTEAPLSPYALACQQRSGWLSTNADPATAYRPFDAQASGFVPGEGGAVFVVEELEHAVARGAVIHGEIAGWGATHDGQPTRRGSSGSAKQYARAMRLALGRAQLDPDEVSLIVPDALGVPEYDRAESSALRTVFGDGMPPVTTQKPLTGRLYQGGSALDVATALLALRHRTVPPNSGLTTPAPGCELNFAAETPLAQAHAALVTARGYDGFNSAVALRVYEESK